MATDVNFCIHSLAFWERKESKTAKKQFSSLNDIVYAFQNIDKFINPENCYKNAISKFTIEKQCDYYTYLFNSLNPLK